MFRKPDPDQDYCDGLLGRALREMPEPEPQPDFNRQIHTALRDSLPHRRSIVWPSVRTAFMGVCGSFAATLALLSISGGTQRAAAGSYRTAANHIKSANTGRVDALDVLVERADLTSASIRTLMQHPLRTQPEPAPVMHAAPSIHLQGA